MFLHLQANEEFGKTLLVISNLSEMKWTLSETGRTPLVKKNS